jgi:hypothetical protein
MENDGYYSPQGIDSTLLHKAYTEHRPWQREGYLFSRTLDHLLRHPGEALERLLIQAWNMWRPTFAEHSLRNRLFLAIPYCVWMVVSLAGVALAVSRRLPCAALLIPLVLFVCLHLLYWGEIRNRQYLTPLLFTFGGLALDRLTVRRARPQG